MIKKTLIISIFAAALLLLASCVSSNPETGIRYNEYIQDAEVETNNMIYGYIGGVLENSKIQILPWDYEIVDTVAGTLPYTYLPKLSLVERTKFDIAYCSWIRDGVFAVENLEPGVYYFAGISRQYDIGNTRYTDTILFPRPEKKENAIMISKDEMVYWGAYNASQNNNDENSLDIELDVADDITKNDVINALVATIKNDTWNETLAKERN